MPGLIHPADLADLDAMIHGTPDTYDGDLDPMHAVAERFDLNPSAFPLTVTEDDVADWLADHYFLAIADEWRRTGVCADPIDEARQEIEDAAPLALAYIRTLHDETTS